MSIFLSHSQLDDVAVRGLVSDLEAFGKKVWLDKTDLVGGDSWWPEILKQIRTCDVFVFAVSANSLESDPCSAEFEYARALHRPILPVEIGDVPEAERRNYEVFSGQLVDYRQPSNQTAIALVRALSEREGSAPDLPDPLPPEPTTPYEYLLKFGPIIRGRADIPRETQETIVAQLSAALRRERSASVRASIISQLKTMRGREEDDLTAKAARDIDAVLAAESDRKVEPEPETRPAAQPKLTPEPDVKPEPKQVPPGWYVDPRSPADLRYWDGTKWTQNVHPVATQPEPQAEPMLQGWYADPNNASLLRYWDGTAWTGHVRPVVQPQHPPLPFPVSPPAQEGTVFSTLGIIVGLLCLIPWVFLIGFVALTFGIIAVAKHQRRGLAALIISIVGPFVGFILTAVISSGSSGG